MDVEAKIKLLENRLEILTASEKENQGVCRRIRRDIRNLNKKRIKEAQ
ncbi:MAG: hypothetical protein J6K53_16600 [Roseburia sp.]|nr:hypothetical protein [Roseburia sp.]